MKTKEKPGIDSTISLYNAHTNKQENVVTINNNNNEWRKKLAPNQYHILREKGTERAFSGSLYQNTRKGLYVCAACGTALFASEDKYDSGTGWPSFTRAIAPGNIKTKADNSLFMRRTEVLCPRCEGHLGHVFDDGPPPTHKRYCINSAALQFTEKNRQ